MKYVSISWQALIALLLCIAALMSLPLLGEGAPQPFSDETVMLIIVIVAASALVSIAPLPRSYSAAVLLIGAHGAAWMLLSGIGGNEGMATKSFFFLIAACWLLAWRCVTVLSELKPVSKLGSSILRLLIPAIFGAWILILWEAVDPRRRHSFRAPAAAERYRRPHCRLARRSWAQTCGRRSSRRC